MRKWVSEVRPLGLPLDPQQTGMRCDTGNAHRLTSSMASELLTLLGQRNIPARRRILIVCALLELNYLLYEQGTGNSPNSCSVESTPRNIAITPVA